MKSLILRNKSKEKRIQKQKTKMNCFFTSILLCFISCNAIGQLFYTFDNSINGVHTHHKNDLEISSSIGKDQYFNYQIMYSPIKHLSIASAYYSYKAKEESGYFMSIKAKSFTHAIGTYYYFKLKNSKAGNPPPIGRFRGLFKKLNPPNAILAELNLGFSKGEMDNVTNLNPIHLIETQYQNAFIRIGFQLYARRWGFGLHHSSNLISFNKAKLIGAFSDTVLERFENDIRKNIFLTGMSLNVYYKVGAFRVFGDVNVLDTQNNDEFREALFRDVISTAGITVNLFQVFTAKSRRENSY